VAIHHSLVVILLLRQVAILQLKVDTPQQLVVILPLLVDIRLHRAPILQLEAILPLLAAISNLRVILHLALASHQRARLIQLLSLVPCL
jgi:hypothetical protein